MAGVGIMLTFFEAQGLADVLLYVVVKLKTRYALQGNACPVNVDLYY